MSRVTDLVTAPVKETVKKQLGITPDTADARTDLLSIQTGVTRYYTTALRLVQTPHSARPLAQGAVILLVVTALALVFVPWQQNVSGSGRVTRFAPNARAQNIESQISARIERWYVNEGARVKAGDTIAVLRDLSTSFMDKDFLFKQQQIRDNVVQEQELDILVSEQKVIQARQKLLAAEASITNVVIEAATARTRLTRAQSLSQQGLVSTKELEEATLKLNKAVVDSVKAMTLVEIERRAVENAKTELSAKQRKAQSVSVKADLDLANSSARSGASAVIAPSDGIVARITQAGPGETVKDGDRLASIVPASDDEAVELMISSMDAALIDTGRTVRLQFSGFPALQFSGWSSIAIGTFGGIVKVIDPVDDGKGSYRILVVPDSADAPWPSQAYLRQGTEATGWVLLSDVPIGYELWRQMNGFPPVIPVRSAKVEKEQGKAVKKVK